MALSLPTLSSIKEIDLDQYPLEKADKQWLTKKLGKTPTIDDVNQLANALSKDARYDDEARRMMSVLTGLQESLIGNFVARNDSAVGADGKMKLVDLQLLSLTGARPVNGESEEMFNVKKQMELALIGQQHCRQAFGDFYAATQAPGRRVPPTMVVAGPDGHGKTQAVQGFATAACSGHVHHVDLFGKTDKDAAGIFDAQGAPLSIDKLKEIGEAGGVVWITGCESIKAPKIAHGVAQRITALKGSSAHVQVPYFLDYTIDPKSFEHGDGRTEVRDLLAQTLDNHGLRSKASQAIFKQLTPEAMLVYAEAMLAQLMKAEGLEGLNISFDQDARAFLGELLATDHKPLNELEARLRELVLRHLDTQTSVYRNGGFIRVALGKPFQDSKDLRDNLIERFNEKHVDLFDGHAAFEPLETGRTVAGEGLAEGLIMTARSYSHLLRILRDVVEIDDPIGLIDNFRASACDLAGVFDEVAEYIDAKGAGRMKKDLAPITQETFKKLDRTTRDFSDFATQLAEAPLLVTRDALHTAIEMRQQIYDLVEILCEGSDITAEHLPMAAEASRTFAETLRGLDKSMSEFEPEKRLANLRVGIDGLAWITDMAGQAAKDQSQLKQLDIIKREDATACRKALEIVRGILAGFALESVLDYGPLVDGVREAGYEKQLPLLMKLCDVASDLIDTMQGEEDERARERSDLAVSALQEFLSNVLTAMQHKDAAEVGNIDEAAEAVDVEQAAEAEAPQANLEDDDEQE